MKPNQDRKKLSLRDGCRCDDAEKEAIFVAASVRVDAAVGRASGVEDPRPGACKRRRGPPTKSPDWRGSVWNGTVAVRKAGIKLYEIDGS